MSQHLVFIHTESNSLVLILAAFWVTSLQRRVTTLHQILGQVLLETVVGLVRASLDAMKLVLLASFLELWTQTLFIAYWLITDLCLATYIPGSHFTSVLYWHHKKYLRHHLLPKGVNLIILVVAGSITLDFSISWIWNLVLLISLFSFFWFSFLFFLLCFASTS